MGIPLIGVLGSLGSALIGGVSAYAGSQAIAGALNNATKVQQNEYNTGLGLLQPSITAGNTARGYQLGALGLPGGVSKSDAEAAFRSSPGYDFALKTGENAAQTSAAAGGTLFSGKTLKDLATYGQGMADQQFGNWYDRVGGISGAGSNAAGQAINLGSNTANNLSQLALGAGQNTASAYGSAANSAIGGLTSLADFYNYYNPPKSASVSSYTGTGTPDQYQFNRI